MARPVKKGIEYFPLDVNFFSDEKTVCVAAECGAIGVTIAVYLFCEIYRKGYYMAWEDAVKMKVLKEFKGELHTLERLEEVVAVLVKWKIFDTDSFYIDKILTSEGIQRRYFEITRKRLANNDLPYLLIKITSEKTVVSASETPVSASETPQSKVK